MGRFSTSAYTEPQKHLAKMLDETRVISEDFKSALWIAADWMQQEAYERGQESMKPKRKKGASRAKA